MSSWFKRKKAPAFPPPDVPMSNVAEQRRPSLFERGSISKVASEPPLRDPITLAPTFLGEQQTTFLGRRVSTAVVPPSARKASLAVAVRDRNPRHLRMGESGASGVPTGMDHEPDVFYEVKLSLDDPDDDEKAELEAMLAERRDKGKKRVAVAWNSDLKPGWDLASPKNKSKAKAGAGTRGKNDKNRKRRHRNKRVQRELDNRIDKFNTYAQNGLTPINGSIPTTRAGSRTGSRPTSRRNSVSSDLSLSGEAVRHATTILSSDNGTYLPDMGEDGRAVLVGDGYDAIDVMADHIFRLGVQKKKWFRAPRVGSTKHHVATGVSIRVKTGLYRTFPVDYDALQPFEEAVTRLNPEIAIKIKSEIVTNIMRTYIDPAPSMSELLIDENTRIQILDEVEHLARARKHQYAAFIRSEGVLAVWADHVESVLPAADALEAALIDFIWRGEEANIKNNKALADDLAAAAEAEKLAGGDGEVLDPDAVAAADAEDPAVTKAKKGWRERPVKLISPVSDGFSIMGVMALLALGLRTLIKEWALDGGVARFALFAFAPLLFFISSFAVQCVVGAVFQMFGPITQVHEKSKYFSGVAPKRTMGELAHVTVQLPVYKESLDEVIMPTVESLKKAITTYERQGGSVGVLVCDDGLQLLDKAEADRRRKFYFDNSLAYVARPGHNVDGFIRKGRFKKAGNMNFAIGLSLRLEEIMDEMRDEEMVKRGEEYFWSDADEGIIYDKALAKALEETEGKAWAGGNIRFGSYILIVDSDTRVPEDCFADAVSEMAESPEVAIIQHVSGVMQVANHFFENGIAHFTRGIQHAISYCCSSGEVAPFVGHNAFIRWSALQECKFVDPDDGVTKIWSEDHVSEDFQIAVTLQMKGYTIRWATYSHGEFQEGVSLTCDDELNRWQKYAFGCSELVFHPFRKWFTKGPITPLFRSFVWSNIPLHSKYSICAYIFSYYAISVSWFLTVVNYFLVGWNLPIDGYYLSSWYVTFVCILLFVGLCNVSFITLIYRLKIPGFAKMAGDQLMWIPFFSIFFTGMSMPMGAALFSHMVGYNMTWSTTVKTVEKSNFFLQMPIIWKRFWPQLTFFTLTVIMVIITSSSIMPSGYRVANLEVFIPISIVSGSHLLWPFALNPWFLSFTF